MQPGCTKLEFLTSAFRDIDDGSRNQLIVPRQDERLKPRIDGRRCGYHEEHSSGTSDIYFLVRGHSYTGKHGDHDHPAQKLVADHVSVAVIRPQHTPQYRPDDQ